MNALRFHHVFFLLMLAALICAFALNPERSAKITPQIQTVFAPIASPARAIGRAIVDRWQRPATVDPRSNAVIKEENIKLEVLVASLTAQLDELKKLNAEREMLGKAHESSRVYAVIGGDAGIRQSLLIGGSTLDGLVLGQPAIYVGGLVGKIVQAGVTGAKVQMITDPQSAVSAHVGRYLTTADGHAVFTILELPLIESVLVHGTGNNTMVIDTLTVAQAQPIKPGDRIVLNDTAWPLNVQGYTLGDVSKIEPRPNAPLYVKITISPSQILSQLPNVGIVLK